MNNMTKAGIIAGSLLGMMLLGGCMKGETENVEKESSPYVSVLNYTGQGYELPNGDKNDQIAEASRDEIIPAMEDFFMDKYKTKIKVNNIVGNKDGASVYVESVGEPHFQTFAIIPIDNKEKVRPEGIWTEVDQVEYAIKSGLYAMVYDEKLKTLDAYLEKMTSEHPIVGMQDEAVKKTSTGFATPYYYIKNNGESLNPLLEKYLDNPDTAKEEILALPKPAVSEEYKIVIELFMKEENQKPDEALFKQIVSDIENMSTLPPGSYSVYLHDNKINKENGYGKKDNTLKRGVPNYIIKK